MNTGLPYRVPCGGWRSPLGSGGCFQHWRTSEAHVPRFRNETDVVDWTCAHATSLPYERPYDVYAGGPPDCYGGAPAYGESSAWCAGNPTKPPCGPWTRAEFATACATGQVRIDTNCYTSIVGGTKNLALCQKVGFKNVQARKVWHGRFGFNGYSEYRDCVVDGDPQPAPATPQDRKYLRCRRDITVTLNLVSASDCDAVSGTSHRVSDHSVNRYSGAITRNECSISEPIVYWPPQEADGYFSEVDYPWDNPDAYVAMLLGFDVDPITCELVDPFPTWGGSVNVCSIQTYEDSEVLTLHKVKTITFTGPEGECEGQSITMAWDISCVVTLSDPYTATDLEEDISDLLSRWDLTKDAIYPWRQDVYTTVAPLVTRDEAPAPVSPDLTDDCVSVFTSDYTGEILGLPFDDGYPEAVSVGTGATASFYNVGASGALALPLQTLGASSISVKREVYADGVYSTVYTGVLGTDYTFAVDEYGVGRVTLLAVEHLPAEWNPLFCGTSIVTSPWNAIGTCGQAEEFGDRIVVTYDYEWIVGGHFDQRHVTRKWQYLSGQWYETRWFGAWSGGSGGLDPACAAMPHMATQWTNSSDAARYPHGAWKLMYGGTGVMIAQKYAEIKLPWKSQNWFGPCGYDRDLKVGQSCSWDDELEECKLSAGTTAWPNAFAIEGDRSCTFTEESGVVTVQMGAAANYLRVGDSVEFTGSDAVVIGSSVTVASIINSSSFTYSGTIPTGASRVKSAGAPAYWWYDTDGKGEYGVITHTFNYRYYHLLNGTEDAGYCTVNTGCLTFERCYPAVMCFSPSYEEDGDYTVDKFPHGTTYPMGDIIVDYRFGSRWQGTFKQVMTDLWYIQPPPVCEVNSSFDGCDTATWTQDDGTCQDDTAEAKHYPHPPLVEFRPSRPMSWNETDIEPTYTYSVTDFAPTAAVGPTDYAHVTTPDGTADALAPWRIWIAMQGCICNGGRWNDDSVDGATGYHYRGYKNVIGCYMCGDEPAVAEPVGEDEE